MVHPLAHRSHSISKKSATFHRPGVFTARDVLWSADFIVADHRQSKQWTGNADKIVADATSVIRPDTLYLGSQ